MRILRHIGRHMWQILRNFFRTRLASDRSPDAGVQGEDRAANFLHREKGMAILARNWRNPRDRREEIDLVCEDRGVLVFVEVKARAAGALVPGYYTVTPKKKKVLLRACAAYLKRLRHRPATYRFDVVEVEHGSNGADEIRHFENVPLFPKRMR